MKQCKKFPAWFLLAFVLCLAPRAAHAYAWMIRDGFTQCSQCHTDPSGAGLVTNFGRAQAESNLRTRYVAELNGNPEPSKTKNFLFNAIDLPQEILLGGNLRGGVYYDKHRTHPFESRADVHAQVKVGQVRVNASVGYMYEDAALARITYDPHNNLVARNYWFGFDFGVEEEKLVRVGRMPLPYGLRTAENSFWVHDLVRNDTNDQQQFGAAFAYGHGDWRGEIMGYAGNIQLSPVSLWERGASGYIEYTLTPQATLGISALGAQSNQDVVFDTAIVRANYGVFARYTPFPRWVLMAELDGGVLHFDHGPTQQGFAALLQSDVVLYHGVHFLASGELRKYPQERGQPHGRGRIGIDWFCLPHTDVRLDGIWAEGPALLAQVHMYL